jgi:hypothetical protein
VAGHDLLLRFIESRDDVSYRVAAELFGLRHPAVWQWAHGVTIPDHRYREAIETWTNGMVPASSWNRSNERHPVVVQPYRPSGTEGR